MKFEEIFTLQNIITYFDKDLFLLYINLIEKGQDYLVPNLLKITKINAK